MQRTQEQRRVLTIAAEAHLCRRAGAAFCEAE